MKDNPRIEFTGYVAEEDIPELFRTASVLVLPYSSATGASGVAHLACEFGVPIISAGIDDFREMARDEGLAIDFYETGNAQSLANAIATASERPRTHARNVGAEFLRCPAHDHASNHSPIPALVRSSSARPGPGADLALPQNSVVGSFALGDLSRGCAEVATMDVKAILLVGGARSRTSARRTLPAFPSPTSTYWAAGCWSGCCSGCSTSASATPR